MERCRETCAPTLDLDVPLPWHHNSFSIPPFQTHYRYFCGSLGKLCCGCHFVEIFYQQFHTYPQCLHYEKPTLGGASHIFWSSFSFALLFLGTISDFPSLRKWIDVLADRLRHQGGRNEASLAVMEEYSHFNDGCVEARRRLSRIVRMLSLITLVVSIALMFFLLSYTHLNGGQLPDNSLTIYFLLLTP